MASPTSKVVIYSALVGNGLIAVTKFTVATLTGSAAMMSEAVHSVVTLGGLAAARIPNRSRSCCRYPRPRLVAFFVPDAILVLGTITRKSR